MSQKIKVKCPGSTAQRCHYWLRLKITPKGYGKTVTVKCPKCDGEFTTTIHTPAENPEADAVRDEDALKEIDDTLDAWGGAFGIFRTFFRKPGRKK